MKVMTYKGYRAKISYSDDDELFTGRLLDIGDVVGFHGKSVAELNVAFAEAVEDYLETCRTLKKRTASNNY